MKGVAPVGIDGELETAKMVLGYIVRVGCLLENLQPTWGAGEVV